MGISAWDEPSCCCCCLQFPQSSSTCLLPTVPIPNPPSPRLCQFRALLLLGVCRAGTGTFHCTFFYSAKTNPTWQEPEGAAGTPGWSSSRKAWLRRGGGTALVHPTGPTPCPRWPVSCPGHRGAGARQAMGAGAAPCRVCAGDRVWGPGRREPRGTKGPLLRRLVRYQVVADVKEAPDPCGAPAPSPGSGSGPRAAPGCGIRGQIRRRSVLATQMSWIGKWGWGEETDPASPEGGSARRWAPGGSWGPCRDPWAPARGARSSTGRAGGIGGRLHFLLHLPVCHEHCSSRSPHTAPACDCTPQCPALWWPGGYQPSSPVCPNAGLPELGLHEAFI